MVLRMFTSITNSASSRLRLLALLAVAHASLALYVWFCASELDLVVTPVRLWVVLAWSWAGWPVLLAAAAQSSGRHALRPNHAVNRTRRFVTSTWQALARRAGYLTR